MGDIKPDVINSVSLFIAQLQTERVVKLRPKG